MIYRQLFLAFFRIGIFGYGGGPSMIPLFYSECVKRYEWVSADDFSDNLALGNALPGPIATKMASYIGYKVKGWKGAVVAISAVSLPVVIVMIVLLNFVYALKDLPLFQGMIVAIQPVIGVMMAVLAYEFIVKGWKDAEKKYSLLFMLTIAVIAIPVFHIHPGIVIAITLAISFLYSTWSAVKRKKMMSKGIEKE
ncbi:MAG: chromate transporter [Bacilli bacterium]